MTGANGPFRFTERWQSRLAALFRNPAPELIAALELRDREIEDLIDTWNSQTAYTPVLYGCAIGTGGSAANTALFNVNAGRIRIEGKLVFGTAGTTFPANNTGGTLPVGLSFTGSALQPIGQCQLITAGGVGFPGQVWLNDTLTFRFIAQSTPAGAGYAADSGLGAAIPNTWNAGSSIVYSVDALVAGNVSGA